MEILRISRPPRWSGKNARARAVPAPYGYRQRDYWASLLLIAGVYALAAGWRITLPGLYMDAVDPDYLVVRILNPHGYEIPPWLLPGNYLATRFPILSSLYHGTQQVWLGLPSFLIFGTTVVGLRITHALFAFGILWALYAVLSKRDLPVRWAALACIALALDPAFVYAFRTQSYLTTAPVMWLLLSVLQLDNARRHPARARLVYVSGLFFGLAVFGYFIYLFFLPAMIAALFFWLRRPMTPAPGRSDLTAAMLTWAGGAACGMALYLAGYILLAINQGGVSELFAYIAKTQASLGAFGSHLSLVDRIANARDLVVAVFSNEWNSALIFGEYTSAPGATWKIAALTALPLALWMVAEARRTASALVRVLLALQVSFFALSLTFGGRLGGHHYVCLLPLSYATLASSLFAAADVRRESAPAMQQSWRAGALLVFVALIGINIAGERQIVETLRKTHGIGLYSDAINRFADDVLQGKRDHFLILPDWGLYMPTVFLTGANVQIATDENIAAARHALCHHRNVSVALIDGDRAARFEALRQKLGWDPPVIEDYRQFDGTLLFQLGTFVERESGQACTH